MPDGDDKKNKKKPDETASASPAPGAAAAPGRVDRGGLNGLRLPLIGLVLVAAVFFGGREIYNRVNFVYSDDSRIEADLITVSSRVAGWVTQVDVSEGSGISVGQVLLIIDSRESKLLVAELDARISGLDAEAVRLAAERRLVDDQTASLYLARTSAPAHIGHGSKVTYTVQPPSRQLPTNSAACVSAIISAWAVGSFNCSR